jgi:hypothetical protein
MNKENLKKGGMRWATLFFIFVAVFAVSTQMIPSPRLVTDEQGFGTIVFDSNIVLANETALPTGSSIVIEVYIVNHSSTPTTAYSLVGGNPIVQNVHNQSGTFEGWANASLDPDGAGTTYYAFTYISGGTVLGRTLTIKWGTSFDFLIRIRGNTTCAKNATMFKNSSCRVKLNTTGGLVTGNINALTLTNEVSCNASDHTFIWINAVANNAGAGYTINKGGTCTIVNIKLEFNY